MLMLPGILRARARVNAMRKNYHAFINQSISDRTSHCGRCGLPCGQRGQGEGATRSPIVGYRMRLTQACIGERNQVVEDRRRYVLVGSPGSCATA